MCPVRRGHQDRLTARAARHRAIRRTLHLLVALVALASAGPARAIALEPGIRHLDLTQHIAWLADRAATLTFAEVRAADRAGGFTRHEGVGAANLGFSQGTTYWVRVRLQAPPGLGAHQYLLVLRHAPLDEVVLFAPPHDDGAATPRRAGERVPVDERPFAGRYPVFPVDLSRPGEHVYYLRVRTTSSVALPLALWEQSAFAESAGDLGLAFGAYYGVMLAMMLYNGLVFLSIRDRLYLYYVIAAASTVVFVFCLNGFASLYLWSATPAWSDRALAVTLCLGVLLTTHFSRVFLRIGVHLPRLDRVLRIGVLAMLGSCAVATVAPYGIAVPLGAALVLLSAPVVLLAGAICWWRRVDQAGYFVLAWLAFLAGAVMHALKAFGVLPATPTTHFGMQIGSAAQYILLSFALADRLRTFKEAKARAQREANERLEWRVAERTRELDQAMNQLRDANRRLQENASIDDLTGVNNRQYFDERFEQEWRRARRVGATLVLMMIDVDHFKRINDDHGHPVGDTVLPAIAGALQTRLGRSSDVLARYGGEEFIALMSGVDRGGAAVVAEGMRAAVADSVVDCGEVRVAVTVSIGLYAFIPGQDVDSPDTAIARADGALYAAKGGGRNRVVDAEVLTRGEADPGAVLE